MFIISVLLAVVVAGCGQSVDSLDVVTPQGLEISNFFMVTLVIGLLVCVLVAVVLAVAVARFRGGRYPVGEEPPQVTGNRRLEITWTLIPVLAVLVLFLISLRIMDVVHANDSPSAGGLPIQVIGHQFWWEYRYPDPSNPSTQVITANELHIPVGQIVRLEVASNDVLHDFWVPQLGWKRDAVPGKTNTMSMTVLRAGTYDGECTNVCGIAHAWMRIRVIAEAGHGGEVLLSGASAALVREALPSGVGPRDLGEEQLKDLTRAEHVFQLVAPDLPSRLPAAQNGHHLQDQTTAMIGRSDNSPCW